MKGMDLGQIYARNDKNRVYVRTDKNGTEIWHDYTCPRCGGAGGADKWTYTGWTCYECGGKGKTTKPQIIKKYTPEYRAKLDEQARKRAEKKRLQRVEEIKAKLPEMIEARGFSKDGKMYLVTGDTYKIKDELREAGAHWNTRLYGWVFTELKEDYPTVEINWEEVMEPDYESGYLNWKDIDYKALIQSKLPKEDVVVSDYIGAIGDKLDMEVTFIKRFDYERKSFSGWGTETVSIYKFIDDNGNILIWNTTAYPEVTAGNRYQIKGTIAEHKEYAGDKQTVLKRCRVTKIKEVA